VACDHCGDAAASSDELAPTTDAHIAWSAAISPDKSADNFLGSDVGVMRFLLLMSRTLVWIPLRPRLAVRAVPWPARLEGGGLLSKVARAART